MRAQFINSQETLLVWFNHDEHSSDRTGFENVQDVFGWATEDVKKLFRIDENWKFEDVTEQVAQAWLDKYGEDPQEMETEGVGAWLEDSQALQDFIDNYHDENSDFEEHNTLNHRTQGV